MPKTKVALTIDTDLLNQVDELVAQQRFRNRSQVIEAALADKLQRLARTRLAREAAKLNPAEENVSPMKVWYRLPKTAPLKNQRASGRRYGVGQYSRVKTSFSPRRM